MKRLIKITLASLALLPLSIFAAEPTCPSINTLRNVTIDNAFYFSAWWGDTIIKNEDGNEWRIEEVLSDSKEHSKEEFLGIANELIKTVPLNEPIVIKEGKYTECFYNRNSEFEVIAIYPSEISAKMMPFKH